MRHGLFVSIAAALALGGCVGCGGQEWTSNDATNAIDIANAALALESMCDRDGGPCPASGVRAVERGTYCAASSMLYRHGVEAPDGGIACKR